LSPKCEPKSQNWWKQLTDKVQMKMHGITRVKYKPSPFLYHKIHELNTWFCHVSWIPCLDFQQQYPAGNLNIKQSRTHKVQELLRIVSNIHITIFIVPQLVE